MKNILYNAEKILNNISGFHQYNLLEPVHLTFVSQNFCDMLGYTEEELLSENKDLYAPLVYRDDSRLYSDFIYRLTQKEQTLTEQYRIVQKDGAIRYVNDTATSKRLEDGSLVAYSVLTDITSIKTENNNLHFLNETIPCGFLKYTCEKTPKITYINEQMLKILKFPEIQDEESNYLEMYKENIYLMIPMEEQRRFSLFLNRVYTQGVTIAGEITIIRYDGTKARLYGWVTRCVNEHGQEEFQSVCMDITERYKAKKASETDRYVKALTEIYDKIFEYDFSNMTVKCLHGQNSDVFRWLQNIPMHLEEAMEKWIESSVVEEDRAAVSKFFKDFFRKKIMDAEVKPPQIKYRALSSSGNIKTYLGIFLKIDSTVSLFCCRSITEENNSLRNEMKNMQEFVMRFTEGIVAFEVEGGNVKPLYASDNVCEFFGYTKEEWLAMAQTKNSIKRFVSKSGVDYEEFMELLDKGEAEFDYIDVKTQIPRRIKAVCSNHFSDGSTHRYVMLYNINNETNKKSEESTVKKDVYIRTFGYFDVFVNGQPIAFRNKKSKELLALMVDRRGGYVSSDEAISFLWEDEPTNALTLARCRKVALRLKNILEEYGISDIMESVDGKRRIVTDKVRCDLYDYLSKKEEFSELFKGSYLTNYSWGETTLGELLNEYIY